MILINYAIAKKSIRAAEIVMDRTDGKPAQKVDVDANIRQLSTEGAIPEEKVFSVSHRRNDATACASFRSVPTTLYSKGTPNDDLACGLRAYHVDVSILAKHLLGGQAGTEAKALELSRYVRFLCDNQADFLKERNPLVKDSATEKIWKNGSRFLAVPGGQNQIRGLHPYGYCSDESAFQPEFSECINAVLPVAKSIIAISTGSPGPMRPLTFTEWAVRNSPAHQLNFCKMNI